MASPKCALPSGYSRPLAEGVKTTSYRHLHRMCSLLSSCRWYGGAGTRNRIPEVLPVPPGESPEVPEKGRELLGVSEAISSWLQLETRQADSRSVNKV